MSTATKLQSILDSKASIKQALINRGYKSEEVGDIFSQYGYLIENISTGGGELETAISDAKYDYIKEYLIDMITESYEITKDWTDYSQANGSDIYFLPVLVNAEGNFNNLCGNCKKLLFFSNKVKNIKGYNFLNGTKRLIRADLSSELSDDVNFYFAFYNSSVVIVNNLTIKDGVIYQQCFGSCSKLKVVNLNEDCGAGSNYLYFFDNCENLVSIKNSEIDFSNISEKENVGRMFNRCIALEEVRFKENTLKVDLDMSYSTLLSHDSLLSIINSCSQVSETQTLKLGETNLAKLSEEEKAIATSKGWTLA